MPNVPDTHTNFDDAVSATLESFPHPAGIIEPTGTIVSLNSLFARFHGRMQSECIGQNIFDLCMVPNRGPIARETFDKVSRTGEPASFEVVMNDLFLKVTINPFRSKQGSISHLTLIIEDESALKHSYESIVKNRKRFSQALDLAQAGIWEANLVTGENIWSDTIWKLYGLTPGERSPSTELWKSTVHPDDLEQTLNLIVTSVADRKKFVIEYRVIHPDGSVRWLLVRGAPITKGNEPAESYIGLVIDITERKLTRQDESRHRRHMDYALEKSHVGVWDMNLDTLVAYRTMEHARIFGQENTLQEWTLDDFLDRIVPEDRPDIEQLIKSSIQEEKEYSFECRIRRLDGEIRWLMVIGSFFKNRSGGDRHVLGIVKDITDTKKKDEEKKQLQAQLLHSQKLEILGQLAGGIAHDFNNHLTAILGNIDLVLHDVPPSEPYVEQLTEIRQTALRSAELTRQLLGFARKQAVVPKVVDMNREIEAMMPMLTRLVGKNISFEWHPGQISSLVFIDPSQLDQILTNLCVNARDAIAGTGRIMIETDVVRVMKRECSGGHICQMPGNYIRLSVTDTGSGIALETLPHIFEPFFTTKEAGKGTGLGLSTVYGIVKQNHGYIECTSTGNDGTSFTIYFMQHAADDTTSQIAGATPDKTGIQKTILLVEDEAEILSLVTSILEKKGYRVLSAADAEKGIVIATNSPVHIDLLLTDIRLPGMNGVELSKHLESRLPNLKTLFMSAYAEGMIDSLSVNGRKVNIIAKPFTIKDLLAAVQQALAPTCSVVSGRQV